AGAMMALAGAAGVTGGTGVHVSPTPAWGTAYGVGAATTATQTILGIATAISVSASLTGPSDLYYFLNGVFAYYSGAFTVQAGDTLASGVVPAGVTRESGTITLVNVSDAAAVLGTVAYSVKGV